MGKSQTGKKDYKQQRQKEMEKKKSTQRLMGWSLAIVLVAFLVLIVVSIMHGKGTGKTVEDKEFHYDQQPALGKSDAPVKIVEFADFKCPACKQFDQLILPQVKKDFVDTGIAQIYFINFPIISPDADSRTAAMAGEAVFRQSPEEFWKFYEAVYAKQGDEHTKWATSDALVQIAKESNLKLDFDKLKKDIDDNTYAQAVRDDEAIAAKLRVNSTPTVYINGNAVPDSDTFKYSAIKDAIEKAKGDAKP
ncbi:DsbA family protein [Paenibacillus hexagrammi]|uniref:DsbA family protein n=1 Tax=Paenibacillus hexagrammi TaxID=2908839 RepID=A0ABY3SJG8_9BACL|nr:thioredoxin domain-containing protein [Paenibacillus sp. YPD9-1]UJF34163.1 DsbA family protein [Paenibacillus sp. YPD9-1]